MRRPVFLASLALVWLSGCVPSSRGPAGCPQIEQLDPARAPQDALAALGKGDDHLLMLGGYAGVVPGGNPDGRSTVLIAGTEDYGSEECRRMRDRAEVYAHSYNEQVLSIRPPSASPGRPVSQQGPAAN